MHIANFRIENYKSFRATAEIALTPGFNVIVGQNNVGKTALVEALSLAFSQQLHRSLQTIPVPGAPLGGNSTVDIRFSLAGEELRQLLSRIGNFWVPTDRQGGQAAARAFNAIMRNSNTITTKWVDGGLTSARIEAISPAATGSTLAAYVRVTAAGKIEAVQEPLPSIDLSQRFEHPLANLIKAEQIYAFDAERLHIGVTAFGIASTLRPDAFNLPEVLATLEKNPARVEKLRRRLQTILPSVRGISIQPRENQQVEILVWTIDPSSERADLAIPLSECGTGIGQVLAILYVVMTADSPKIILIDEPQSFLHPGAVRKLIETLKEYPQHQFIITTHSPTALIAADPETLLRLQIKESETIVDRLDTAEARDLRIVLADVGARISDVFGADAILWVEGQTEELCFPRIVRGLLKKPLMGTVILGVLHTADFDPRRSGATVELYSRLSRGRGLMPPALGFIFDREGRTDQEREDLARYGNVFFLPRRMYENYLLNAAAIASVASATEGFRDSPVVAADVQTWLDAHRWDDKYFDRPPAERTTENWLSDVHGAKLLSDLFTHLSTTRVHYDKARDGVALTEWLLENAPEELRDVAQMIERALGSPIDH